MRATWRRLSEKRGKRLSRRSATISRSLSRWVKSWVFLGLLSYSSPSQAKWIIWCKDFTPSKNECMISVGIWMYMVVCLFISVLDCLRTGLHHLPHPTFASVCWSTLSEGRRRLWAFSSTGKKSGSWSECRRCRWRLNHCWDCIWIRGSQRCGHLLNHGFWESV